MFASVASAIAVILALMAYKEVSVIRAHHILNVRGYRESQAQAVHTQPKASTDRRPLILPPLPNGKPNLLIENYRTRVVGVGHGNN